MIRRVIAGRSIPLSLLACTPAVLVGGCTLGDSGLRRGTPITYVQADFGLPDVISDRSGDQARFYLPTSRPAEEWPADAPRTFYYLKRNVAVTFVLGRAVRAGPIEGQLREQVLLPLVQRGGFRGRTSSSGPIAHVLPGAASEFDAHAQLTPAGAAILRDALAGTSTTLPRGQE